MSVYEILVFAVRGLSANKLRSALTTLGILIGVGSVILLLAYGNGSSEAVKKSISRLGANTLTVMKSTSNSRSGGFPGGGGFPGLGGGDSGSTSSAPRTQIHELTIADAKALTDRTNAPAVKSASPVVQAQSATATYEGSSHSISQFVGTWPGYFEAQNKQIASGSAFTQADNDSGDKVVVIGQTVATDLFGTVNPIGKAINVNGITFNVTGVLKKTGSTGFQDGDDIAVAPLNAVQQSLTGYGSVSQIVVQATSDKTVDAAQTQVTTILNERHDISGTTTADFSILNQASLQSTVTQSNQTFTVLLGAVAGISLLVGGIGVTNIMLVTVTERTREIGIRKAIGAPKYAILGQFIAEATVLSLLGGILGVIAGVVGSRFKIYGTQPVIIPASIALALGVSIAIGLFFGSYPANRAAKLRPIEALRHE